MSTRSSVFIGLRKKLSDQIPPALHQRLLKQERTQHLQAPQGTAYYLPHTRWSRDYGLAQVFYAWLHAHDEADYIVIENCFDYPEADADGSEGCWDENPWEARIVRSAHIEFTDPLGDQQS